jgi:beta-glucosidase
MSQIAPPQSEQDERQIAVWMADLTLAEKVSLLAGESMWTTVSIERLGIPAMKVSDGPNGARGAGGFVGGKVTSACFPVGIALASTWNPALVEQVGQAIGEEAQTKNAQMVLAPTVNIHRSPLNGRNFECYSEDPYLSARMAMAYIQGLQSRNVGGTVKHYVCNDSEFERNSISSEVGERALREIYLPPFQAAVQEAHTWGLMSAYNQVNGVFAAENPALLIDILKDEWGFDGIVMSDWFGTKSTAAAVNNGLDLEMPGPAQWRGEKLRQAVQAGEVDMDALDEAVRRMLRVILRSGVKPHEVEAEEMAVNRPDHQAIARQAAAEGIVLLKNQADVLPLDLEAIHTIAVIGPNAKTAQIMGGGSAQVNAHYAISPYAGLVARVGEAAHIGYELGCTNHKVLGRVAPDRLGDGQWTLAYYDNPDLAGEAVHQETTASSEQVWLGYVAPGIDPHNFSARLTGQFVPQQSGIHTFGLTSAGLTRLLVDGAELIDNWTQQTPGDAFFGAASAEVLAQIEMTAGQTYDLCMEYSSQGAAMLAAARLGHLVPVPKDSLQRAAKLAAESDVALVFVGHNGDWDTEGHDRADLELVGDQVTLIEAVAAANPRTIVVLQTGAPVVMPWLDQVAGVLQAWYPGQECGNAIADVLVGDVNPSGRLSQTFPMRLEDNPAYINYPGENDRVHYGEGIFVGYRYYEKKKIAPLFPFGFGLSYTTFEYGRLNLSASAITPDEQLVVRLAVTNSGTRAGQEVVQLYVRDVKARLSRPEKELKAFVKVGLAAGETQTVTLTLDKQALAYWDDHQHAWVAEAGEFEVLVGSSSDDIRATGQFTLSDTAIFGGPPRTRPALSLNSLVREILADPQALAVVDRHVPGFSQHPPSGMVLGFSLTQIASMRPTQFTETVTQAIEADLQALAGGA